MKKGTVEVNKTVWLICRKGTDRYFADGAWTDDRALANSYADAVEVAQVCADYDLREVELELVTADGHDRVLTGKVAQA